MFECCCLCDDFMKDESTLSCIDKENGLSMQDMELCKTWKPFSMETIENGFNVKTNQKLIFLYVCIMIA